MNCAISLSLSRTRNNDKRSWTIVGKSFHCKIKKLPEKEVFKLSQFLSCITFSRLDVLSFCFCLNRFSVSLESHNTNWEFVWAFKLTRDQRRWNADKQLDSFAKSRFHKRNKSQTNGFCWLKLKVKSSLASKQWSWKLAARVKWKNIAVIIDGKHAEAQSIKKQKISSYFDFSEENFLSENDESSILETLTVFARAFTFFVNRQKHKMCLMCLSYRWRMFSLQSDAFYGKTSNQLLPSHFAHHLKRSEVINIIDSD